MPDPEALFDRIQSSDRFAERVEEIAERFHDEAYNNDRILEIKASFRDEAEDAGLSEGEAKALPGGSSAP